MTDENLMTATDSHGASIVVGVWIAPPGENDGYSVLLDEGSRERIAKFLFGGAS